MSRWTQLYNEEKHVYEVPYRFDAKFAYGDDVRNDLRSYLAWMNSELSQCIEFVERPEEQFYFSRLNIISAGDGCWSYIGRLYWEQFIREMISNLFGEHVALIGKRELENL